MACRVVSGLGIQEEFKSVSLKLERTLKDFVNQAFEATRGTILKRI